MNDDLMNARAYAERIFLAGVESVEPGSIIRKQIKLDKNTLNVANQSFNIEAFKNIYVIGAGKATALMAREIETILGERISEGHVIVKHGSGVPLKYITITEADHPIPDSNGIKATKDIIRIAAKSDAYDLVLCLLSGGGSSLLSDYPESCTLEDIKSCNRELVNCGATIHEINTVRKHLSMIKGGHLARKLYPATSITLVLSDVIGNSLEVISSGPTFPDSTTFQDAMQVFLKYDLRPAMPQSITVWA